MLSDLILAHLDCLVKIDHKTSLLLKHQLLNYANNGWIFECDCPEAHPVILSYFSDIPVAILPKVDGIQVNVNEQ